MLESLTNNLDLWTSALLHKSIAGRGSNGKQEAYGIQKLRELILELAVRGKLVPQDSNDEPGSELLKRTIAARTQLIKEGVLRDAKPPVVPAQSPDHELPGSWVWTRLHEIGEIAPRNEADDFVEASFVPMQAISEKYGVRVHYEVRPWGEIKSGFTHFREKDVVLAKITPCFQNGKSAVMRGLKNGFGAGTTELHVFRSIDSSTVPEYVLIYLKSPRFIGDGIPKMTGTAGQKRITRDYFAGNDFPLPPLAEQYRIVAKVHELMALCDQLEQQQTQSIEAQQTLVATLLGTLTRVVSPQEQAEAWTRVASHFDTLFTTEHSIDQLKQTILQLAVTGKLVRQAPTEKPPTVLLKAIAAEKALLVEQGKIREVPSPTARRAPFSIPDGWVWSELADLAALVTDGDHQAPPQSAEGIPFLVIGNLNTGVIDFGGCKFVQTEYYDKLDWGRKPSAGDLLYTVTGSFGIPILVDTEKSFCVQRHVAILKATPSTPHHYLALVLASKFAVEYATAIATGIAQKTVPITGLRRMPIPVPSEEEQHRIVAKVDELMALCDALKARLAEAQTTQVHLADAIVEQAVA